MKIQIGRPFHAAGDTAIQEDRYAIHPGKPNQVIVADGVSGLYLPTEEPRTFFGLSGGQLAAQITTGLFSFLYEVSLEEKLNEANEGIRHVIRYENLSLEESEFLPGTTFLALEANEAHSEIQIFSAGDCFAFWRTPNGSLNGTPNTMFDYEQRMTQKIAELMQEAPGQTLQEKREHMWEAFRPFLARNRREAINKKGGYALLNGQFTFEELLFQIIAPVHFYAVNMEEGLEMVVCSDGFIPFELTQDPQQAASFVFHHYDQGGLKAVADETWRQTAQKEWESHVSRPEATAIPITVVE